MNSKNYNNTIQKLEKKLIGIDKWIVDFYFLKGYFKRTKEIIKKNYDNAEFIQTRLLLDKYWTDYLKKVNPIFMSILEQEEENYFLDNYFLYDHFIFKKMILKECDDNLNHRNAIVLHPILFIINLSILLYLQDNRKLDYFKFIYTKYNFNYEVEGNYFSTKNKLLFDETYNKLIISYENLIKISIKDFYNSITEGVLRKFIIEKYDIELEILEVIINYSKNICGDGNTIFPNLEFSPLHTYLSSTCILEGLVNEILNFMKPFNFNVSILCFDNEIYIFFNNYNNWFEIKLIIEKILFKNKFELDYKNLVVIKNNNKLIKQENSLIKFNKFYYDLTNYFKNDDIFIDSSNILRKYLEEQNLNNSIFSIDLNDINYDDYKKMINIVNSIDNGYFRIIDSHPKYFIRSFTILDKKYSNCIDNTSISNYLNKKLVSKFSEYKNTEKMINEEYYIYYYLYNSFKGLFNNKIYGNKFLDNIDSNYISFQEFIINVYDKELYSYLADNPEFKIKHNKQISSLLFFLHNQFRLHNYNDCILITCTLYEWMIKNNINKKWEINDFINYLNNEVLPNNDVDKFEIDSWNKIKDSRNKLTSCHVGCKEDSINYSIDELREALKEIIEWIYKSIGIEANNNFNKLVYCISKKIIK